MNTEFVDTRQFFSTAHKLQNWALFWVLSLLCSYEGFIQYFQPKGFNAFKLFIAGIMLIAFCLLVRIAWRCIQHKSTFSWFFIFYYAAYIAYCIITVLRSARPDVQVIANLIGNHTTGLGLLVPLIAVAGDRIINYDVLLRTGLKLIGVGILLTPLGLVSGRLGLFASPFVQFSYLLLPFWLYLNKKQRQLLIAGLVACLLVSLLTNVRAVLMREFLLIGCFMTFYTLRQISVMTIVIAIMTVGTMVTLTMYADDITRLFAQREIDVFGIKIDNDQNRAWMYEEVYGDLDKKSDLLFGRGALGKYFSAFFYATYEYQGDSADDYNRYNIEVGLLAYLLKGGYVLVWSTLFLLLVAGFLGVKTANNTFVKGLGIVLLCHVAGMFIENYPKLAAYDVIIWLYAGACLSTTMRISKDPFQSFRQQPRHRRTPSVQAIPDYQPSLTIPV